MPLKETWAKRHMCLLDFSSCLVKVGYGRGRGQEGERVTLLISLSENLSFWKAFGEPWAVEMVARPYVSHDVSPLGDT